LTSAVLTAVLGDVCARLRLAPNLVANNQEVKRLVRARFAGGPPPDDTPLTRGWRATAILPELLAVLEGRRTVRIADVKAAAPFAYADVQTDDPPAA
jgi:ribonuclease D